MKIWYFSADPETGLVKAGYTVDGQRHNSLVCIQGGRLYVRTGAKFTGDLALHWFSEEQTAAYQQFIKGPSWAVEFRGGIL